MKVHKHDAFCYLYLLIILIILLFDFGVPLNNNQKDNIDINSKDLQQGNEDGDKYNLRQSQNIISLENIENNNYPYYHPSTNNIYYIFFHSIYHNFLHHFHTAICSLKNMPQSLYL